MTFSLYNLLKKKPNKQIRQELNAILGFYPKKINLYIEALTHRSASIIKNNVHINYERLEFLGDAILDAIIGEYLYTKYPLNDEGFLTLLRSKIVSRESLSEISKSMGLDKLLVTHISDNNDKGRICADAFEALIGAIFIDKGYNKTRDFILNNIIKNYIDIPKLEKTNTNYKSILLEWSQRKKKELHFITNEETDIDNNVYFETNVEVNDIIFGRGTGKTKKEAEQKAAENALINLQIKI